MPMCDGHVRRASPPGVTYRVILSINRHFWAGCGLLPAFPASYLTTPKLYGTSRAFQLPPVHIDSVWSKSYILLAARAGGSRGGPHLEAAGEHSHRAGGGAAQFRRQAGERARHQNAGELEREAAGVGGDSLRRCAHRPPGLHGRSAAGRSGRDAPRGREAEEKSEADRAARAG